MEEDVLKKANKIKSEIHDINIELKVWHQDLTSKEQMAYRQKWNNNHATKLETNISSEVFEHFRLRCIEHLQMKLLKLKEEFERL